MEQFLELLPAKEEQVSNQSVELSDEMLESAIFHFKQSNSNNP